MMVERVEAFDTVRESFASVFVRVVVAGMLVWALVRHPYGYYTLLRWVTSGVSVYCLILAIPSKRTGWSVTFGSMALLFNPVIPVHLDRGTWSLIDLAAAAVIVTSIPFVPRRRGS